MRSRILGILNRLFWLCYVLWVILALYVAPWHDWTTPSYPATLNDVAKYSGRSLQPDPRTHTLTDAQVTALEILHAAPIDYDALAKQAGAISSESTHAPSQETAGLIVYPLPWQVKHWRQRKSILETLGLILAPILLRRALIWVSVGR
jgi:hypothetical protein